MLTRHLLALLALFGLPILPALAQSPLAVIGGESAPAGEEIGQLGPALVTSRRVIVFDDADKRLRVFDTAGVQVQVAGREGAGPGEFRYAYGMTMDSAGHLLVLDPANGRITRYALSDTLRLLGTDKMPINAYYICVSGRTIYVSSFNESGLVHELSDGKDGLAVVRSLGEPRMRGPLGENHYIVATMGNGPLACVPGQPVVMAGSTPLGVVQILRTDMQDQRTVELPGFERMVMTPHGNGLTYSVPESGSYDMLVALDGVPGGVVATVHRVRSKGRIDESVNFRRILVTPAGEVRKLGTSQWREIGASRGRVYCASEDPYPAIAAFEGSACP